MQDILQDEKPTARFTLNKKSMIFLIAYIPLSWLIFLICSPKFMSIYHHEIGIGSAADATVIALATPVIFIGWLILKRLSAMHWKIYLYFTLESTVAVAGMYFIIALLMYHQQVS